MSFVICALILAAHVHVIHIRLRTPDTAITAAPSVWRDPPFLGLIVFTLLGALSVDFFLVGIPVYVLDVLHGPSWLPGAIMVLLTVCGIGAGMVAMRVVGQIARTSAMAIRSGLYVMWCGASLAAVLLPDGWLVPYLLSTTLLLAAGNLLGPVSNALAEATAPRAVRGRYLATFQYAFTIAGVLAPAIVALFTYAIWLPWAVVAVGSMAAIGGSTWLANRLPAAAVHPHRTRAAELPQRAMQPT